ncbi:MAG: hypothetical protein AAGC60_24450 [Acidobacteriota bacterium]
MTRRGLPACLFAALLTGLATGPAGNAPAGTASAQSAPLAMLDLVSLETEQGGSELVEKLEGTVSLGHWALRPLPTRGGPDAPRRVAVSLPFTLHPARDGVYQRLRLAVVFEPTIRVVDLIPARLDEEPYASRPGGLDASEPLARNCRAHGLEPTVRSFGLGEHQVSWIFERRKGLRAGSKAVCALVEVAADAGRLSARLVVDAEIGRPLLPLSKATRPAETRLSWPLPPGSPSRETAP